MTTPRSDGVCDCFLQREARDGDAARWRMQSPERIGVFSGGKRNFRTLSACQKLNIRIDPLKSECIMYWT